jgi:hypothetical protein
MADERPNNIGMRPPHPGDFIRTEILDELHLSVARATEILGGTPGNSVRPDPWQSISVAGTGVADRESL